VSAEIIQFPQRVRPAPEDAEAEDCRNCVNARFGRLTHCVLVGEDILDEARTASECEAFEKEQE